MPAAAPRRHARLQRRGQILLHRLTVQTLAEWAVLVRQWFPQLADTTLRQISWPQIAVHRDYIVAQLEAGVTKQTIWQRLHDEQGLTASVASLKGWIAANLPEQARRSKVRVLREDPPPGQEAQIDYGYLGSWVDPLGGRRRRVWGFVMVLACSGHLFLRPVLTMDQAAWTECHVEAFAFFGGVPARLVPDNLRTGVERADVYDPLINRWYAELAAHYRVLIDPARAAKPRDQARVERPMPYCRDSFFRGREFTSLAQMQQAAAAWSANVAGRRAHRGLDGAAPAAVFAAVEAETLVPLPRTAFTLATWSRPTVGPDLHVKVGRSLYSVPCRFIGQKVDARTTATTVQIFPKGELLASHPFIARGKRTDFAHYPPEKIAFRMRTPTWCRTRAAEIGEDTAAVIADLLAVNALFRLRAAQGVLGLADKHGPARLEAACGKALRVGDPTYRTVKGILAARAEADPTAADDRRRRGRGVPARARAALRQRRPAAQRDHRDHDRDDDRGGPAHHARGAGSRRGRRAHPRPGRGGLGMSLVEPALHSSLRALKLSGMLETLDARLAQARAGELGHLEFLQVLCHDEIARRETVAMIRRLRRARFESQATSRASTSPPTRNCPPRRSATLPRCVGWPPETA